MTLRKIAILSLVLLLSLNADAQRRKKRTVSKPVVEEPQEDPRITNMRNMTQKIIIIDSIISDKEQFLTHMKISSEAGTIIKHADFLQNKMLNIGYTFLNEMGNKVYFAANSNVGSKQLYTSDKLDGKWSTPTPLQGINDGINSANYPFMLSDGITLYFAGEGEESIGGYDIFLTRYDSNNSRFFKPENIGMPFNSEANDYMLAIDELNQIGYFVSDRRQPEDKVCIYIFIPTESRKTYDASEYTEEQIRNFADITSISDTWGNGTERKNALTRLQSIGQQKKDSPVKAEDIIIINDRITYTSHLQLKSQEGANLYKELQAVKSKLNTISSQLEEVRDYYPKATVEDRKSIQKEILQAEDEVLQLNNRAKLLEKQIRNAENKVIN